MARRKEHFIYAARVLSHAILFRGTRARTFLFHGARARDQARFTDRVKILFFSLSRIARSISSTASGHPAESPSVFSVPTSAHNRYSTVRAVEKEKKEKEEEGRDRSIARSYNRHERDRVSLRVADR